MSEALQKKRAVALKYPEGVDAPLIMAKGQGRTAELMIEEAVKNNIHIAEDAVLVDMLGMSETGSMVPETAWKALAVIFSYIIGEKNEHEADGR
jgi:flagellar biosynthesis protein